MKKAITKAWEFYNNILLWILPFVVGFIPFYLVLITGNQNWTLVIVMIVPLSIRLIKIIFDEEVN